MSHDHLLMLIWSAGCWLQGAIAPWLYKAAMSH